METLQQPLIWIPAAGVVLAILAFLGARQARGGTRIGLSVVGATCVLVPVWLLVAVFAPELIDARIRTYKAFYADLQTGMTREEVLVVMDTHYPADGARRRPTIMKDDEARLGFFMDPEQAREPNCEGIFLDFADGRVTRKNYSRD